MDERLNRSLGQYGRHAKAELHEMAVKAMRVVECLLTGKPLIIRGVWWERVR